MLIHVCWWFNCRVTTPYTMFRSLIVSSNATGHAHCAGRRSVSMFVILVQMVCVHSAGQRFVHLLVFPVLHGVSIVQANFDNAGGS